MSKVFAIVFQQNVTIRRMKIQRWHQGNDYAKFKENIAHIRFDICMMIIDRWSHIAHIIEQCQQLKFTWTHIRFGIEALKSISFA